MSDLASCCEYLTIEKLCSAISESEKAKANRQLKCRNNQKNTCCYLCPSRQECAISCKFLGNTGNESSPDKAEKTEDKSSFNTDKTEASQTEKASVTCCSSCNVEMSQTKTKFKINGWSELHPNPSGNSSGEEFLPATVYLCPQCGKIEFKADRELNRN